MALTFAKFTEAPAQPQAIGQYKVVLGTLTFDSSYPTGGEAVAASLFGLNKLVMLYVEPASGYVPNYVRSTGKVIVRWTGAGTAAVLAEVTNALDLSAAAFHVQAWGY